MAIDWSKRHLALTPEQRSLSDLKHRCDMEILQLETLVMPRLNAGLHHTRQSQRYYASECVYWSRMVAKHKAMLSLAKWKSEFLGKQLAKIDKECREKLRQKAEAKERAKGARDDRS